MTKRSILATLLFLAVSISGFAQGSANTIRVGAFPNVTHAQAMVGKANGFFDKAMGPQVKVQWTSFNAGPSAIEALFAGAIDMTYVGPNPAINGYVRSNGEALRVVAGAASGGASLIVRNDSGINKAGRLSRQARRFAAIWQHARCRSSQLAQEERSQDERQGR